MIKFLKLKNVKEKINWILKKSVKHYEQCVKSYEKKVKKEIKKIKKPKKGKSDKTFLENSVNVVGEKFSDITLVKARNNFYLIIKKVKH